MAHVIPSSTTSISLTPSVAFLTEKLNKQLSTAQNYALPLSTSVRLFPQFRIGCFFSPKITTHIPSAIGTDVVVSVQEANTTPKEDEASEISAKRSRPARKSDMPPVKNDELLPGANFTGKVRSIQAFGAFVDFGAFTDGLVHVSQLSDSFVKDVASVVTVGQEVSVRLVEANMETGRISLTMRESDDNTNSDKSRPPRKTGQKDDNLKLDEKLSQGVVHTATNPFVLAFRSNKEISGFLDEQVEKESEVYEDTSVIVKDYLKKLQ